MNQTPQSVYIKNTFQIKQNMDRGLYEDYKQAYKDLLNAQQRYRENLTRMEGRHER